MVNSDKNIVHVLVAICFILITLCCPITFAKEQPADSNYFDMSLEELLSINVISASRSLTSIVEAPSVMTVITAEDISKQGLKTLEEVLQRVPGFFPTEAGVRAIISNRGIPTSNFLLLIDGHSVNSIVKNGPFQQHIYPLLDNIERVEVIRGPGSTLWGSEAALGVINIITRGDWDKINSPDFPHGRLNVSYDYADNIEQHIAKLSYDKGFWKNNGLMLTGNWFTSNPPWLSRASEGGRNADSFIVRRGSPSVLRDFDDSYEVYGKLKLNSFLLSGRVTRFESRAPHLTNTGIPDRRGHFEYENDFIEVKYNLEVGDNSDIDFRVFYDRIRDHDVADITAAGFPLRFVDSDEDGIGGEIIYTTEYFDNHKIKTGTSYRYVDVSLHETRTTDGILSADFDQAEPGIDNTYALFAEDTWNFADKWIAVFGGRIDYNDFREEETLFLPRAGLIWKTTDRVTLKYLYNTGYIRPYVEQSHGTAGEPFYNSQANDFWVGAKDSQKVESHDIQVLYNHNDVYFGATFYYLTFGDFINYSGAVLESNPEPEPDIRATFQNLNEVTSKGVELDFKVKLFDPLTIYGNYSYTHARIESMIVDLPVGVTIDLTGNVIVEPGGAFTGAPEHIWHFGIDYNIVKDVDLNVHYRGWSEAWVLETRLPKYKKFGPEHYVDLNLRWKNILNAFDLSVYCKDLFDNIGSNPPTVASGPPVPVSGDISGIPTPKGLLSGYGRIVGLKVEFKY